MTVFIFHSITLLTKMFRTTDNTRRYRSAAKTSVRATDLLPLSALNPSVSIRTSSALEGRYYNSNHLSDELIRTMEAAQRENTLRVQYQVMLGAKSCVPYTMRCSGDRQVNFPATIK